MDDDLYDEFGNFIGEEAEASEEESEHGVDVGGYIDDDYPEEAPEEGAGGGMELMEVDGKLPRRSVWAFSQNGFTNKLH